MIRQFKLILSGCAMALVVALTATPAAAQLDDLAKAQKNRTPTPKASTTLAPPPALPGATSHQDQAIPSNRQPSEMSPNEALFDAINRGDIVDARDAIKRGADLGARNILGLTPIDLSVDLGHNDITFLMLSLRGASTPVRSGPGGRGPDGRAVDSGAKTAATAAGTGAHPVKPQPAPAGHHPPAPTLVAARSSAADRPQKHQPLSSDPGTPAPQSGFLGFGRAPQQ